MSRPAKALPLSLESEHTPNLPLGLLPNSRWLVRQVVEQSATALGRNTERKETPVKWGGQKVIKGQVEGSNDVPRLYAVIKEVFAQGGLLAAVLPS